VIDETAKTIVVTADTGYHTVADVKRAALNAGLTTPVTGNWEVGIATGKAITDKVTSNLTAATCGATCGQSRVTLAISGSEPFYANATGGSTGITINGLGTPFVNTIDLWSELATPTAAENSFSAVLNAKTGLLTSRYVTFYTSYAGAGVLSFTATADGVNDAAGNRVVAPVTFTVS